MLMSWKPSPANRYKSTQEFRTVFKSYPREPVFDQRGWVSWGRGRGSEFVDMAEDNALAIKARDQLGECSRVLIFDESENVLYSTFKVSDVPDSARISRNLFPNPSFATYLRLIVIVKKRLLLLQVSHYVTLPFMDIPRRGCNLFSIIYSRYFEVYFMFPRFQHSAVHLPHLTYCMQPLYFSIPYWKYRLNPFCRE